MYCNSLAISSHFHQSRSAATKQARSQKLLLGGSFGQNVDLFGKIVDLFYKTVNLLNELEDIFSKIMAF